MKTVFCWLYKSAFCCLNELTRQYWLAQPWKPVESTDSTLKVYGRKVRAHVKFLKLKHQVSRMCRNKVAKNNSCLKPWSPQKKLQGLTKKWWGLHLGRFWVWTQRCAEGGEDWCQGYPMDSVQEMRVRYRVISMLTMLILLWKIQRNYHQPLWARLSHLHTYSHF